MNGESQKEAIKDRLEHLARAGRLTAQAVVQEAGDPKSPLHGYFEWNDEKASAKYRLVQARRLIRSVHITIVEETRVISTVAYVRDPDAGPHEPGYVRTMGLRDDRDRARMAITNEIGRVSAHVARVQTLAAALGLDKQAGELADQVSAFEASLEAV